MLQPITLNPEGLTLAELVELFGPMPAHRIRHTPAPGTATEEDWLELSERGEKLLELVEGVLVEKPMGHFESRLAAVLIYLFELYLDRNPIGFVVAPDGMTRYFPGLIRAPDVAFTLWDRMPNRRVPRDPLPDLVPDLAVEILSKSNTKKEMDRKRREYFEAGGRLVWYVQPKTMTATVYTSLDDETLIGSDGSLEGGGILPGFSVSLREWFRRAEEPPVPGNG